MILVLFFGAFTATVTAVLGYIMWLGHGCNPILPIISELGTYRSMYTVFSVGMVLLSANLQASNVDATYASGWIFITRDISRCHKVGLAFVHGFMFVFISFVSLALVGVGFFRLNTDPILHGLCALVVGVAGQLWGGMNILRLWLFNHLELSAVDLQDSSQTPTGHCLQPCLQKVLCAQVLLYLGALLATAMLVRAWLAIDNEEYYEMYEETTNNFLEYCERDRPKFAWLALWEWLLVIHVCAGFLVTNYTVLRIYERERSLPRKVVPVGASDTKSVPAVS